MFLPVFTLKFRPHHSSFVIRHSSFVIPSRPERGSVTRSNVTHPPAGHRPTRSTTQSVMDCGGRAQRRHRFRPHPTLPITPGTIARTIRHSSFVIRHSIILPLRLCFHPCPSVCIRGKKNKKNRSCATGCM